jgi:hypothetical protein
MLERKEEIKSLESREFYNSHRFYGSNSVITFYLLASFPPACRPPRLASWMPLPKESAAPTALDIHNG